MTQPTVSKHWWETSARLSHNWSHVTHTARQHSYLGERQLRETFDGKHHHCYHTTEVMSHTQRDNIATSESGSWQRCLMGNISTVITQLKSCHTHRDNIATSESGSWQRCLMGNISTVITQLKSCHTQRDNIATSESGSWQRRLTGNTSTVITQLKSCSRLLPWFTSLVCQRRHSTSK